MSAASHSAPFGLLGWAAIACIVLATIIVLWFLVASPPLERGTKLLLLLGVAVLPIGAAVATNLSGFERTTHRDFCGGCHLMTPYTEDSSNLLSETLASRHARNLMFGEQNCYRCHSTYGMFGTVLTKLNGMKHVYYYYLGGWRRLTIPEAFEKIHIASPFENASCMQCHSTRTPYFHAVPDHRGAIEDIRREVVSCADAGCHGPAHPFSKKAPVHGAAEDR